MIKMASQPDGLDSREAGLECNLTGQYQQRAVSF